ncbi:MAG: methylated-DNA--[protein]-cysteine S-methyltransferase [Treponemataceae bacterium]|nr:methylated-DNA--[protein]-cysteine S-methyltransferase [Treponemataceae bacterium]
MKSKTSFENFFKTHAGITPNEYISRQISERPYCFCEIPLGLIRIEENNYGITSLRFIDDKAQNISTHGKGIYLASAKAQISEYFFKRRKTFDIPLSLAGSEFQKKVWSALQSIPYGETHSYKQIAEIVGNKNAARAVGMANNHNPIPIIIPCHRVIGSDGKLVGYGGGIERKEYLLKMEFEQE